MKNAELLAAQKKATDTTPPMSPVSAAVPALAPMYSYHDFSGTRLNADGTADEEEEADSDDEFLELEVGDYLAH